MDCHSWQSIESTISGNTSGWRRTVSFFRMETRFQSHFTSALNRPGQESRFRLHRNPEGRLTILDWLDTFRCLELLECFLLAIVVHLTDFL